MAQADEPDERDNAASIRMCYENGPDESIRVRLANNRVFSQYVRISGAYGLWSAELTELDLSLPGLVHEAAHYLLTVEGDEATVFLPPLRYVDVVVQRPGRAGTHLISFRNEVNSATLVADVLIYSADTIDDFSLVGNASPFLQALLEVILVCGEPQLVAIGQDVSIKQAVDVAVAVVKSCVPKIKDADSALGRLFRNKIAQHTTSAVAEQIDDVSSKLSRALRLLKFVELVGYLADLAVEDLTGSLNWQIRGMGRIRPLGDWNATCSDVAADSNRLYRHLVLREPFTRRDGGTATSLHRFDEWEPYAEQAVAPLARCGDGHLVAVADDVAADWLAEVDAIAVAIVRDLILAFVAPAPTSGYTAVTAGDDHSCGLHADQTITCWGNDDHDQLYGPEGRYTAVSAGGSHTCGLRTDRTITCWGLNDREQTAAPAGRFTAVSAGGSHTCGLRTNRTITCWGSNRFEQIDAPAGQFTAVAAGGLHSCALRADQTIACWGATTSELPGTPTGRYVAITAAVQALCALGADQTVTCWGTRDTPPDGTFSAVSAGTTVGTNHSCALRADQTIACWGNNSDGQTDAPDGTYTDIAAGRVHACALRDDGTIACWGDNDHGQTDSPSNVGEPVHAAIAAGGSHGCMLTEGGAAICWGNKPRRPSRPAVGHVLRRRGRQRPHLRAAGRPDHRLLGQQRQRPSRPAVGPIHRHHGSPRPHVRPLDPRDPNLLGRE